jgi:hypothetical protein
MAARRTLAEGVTIAPELEEEFVRSGRTKPTVRAEPVTEASAPRETNAAKLVSRSPFSTRLRSDFSTALKRASLERQLSGVIPNTLQDILEEALEPWLRKNGYLQ